MLQSESTDSFTEFIGEVEPRLRQALTARFGFEAGKDAAAEALAYAWENWQRLREMDNPAGYLYRVGSSRAKDALGRRRPVSFPDPPQVSAPWVEPGLPAALTGLPARQRTVVMLLHGYGYSMSEVAEVLGITKATVQKHAERGMARLRKSLKVKP